MLQRVRSLPLLYNTKTLNDTVRPLQGWCPRAASTLLATFAHVSPQSQSWSVIMLCLLVTMGQCTPVSPQVPPIQRILSTQESQEVALENCMHLPTLQSRPHGISRMGGPTHSSHSGEAAGCPACAHACTHTQEPVCVHMKLQGGSSPTCRSPQVSSKG